MRACKVFRGPAYGQCLKVCQSKSEHAMFQCIKLGCSEYGLICAYALRVRHLSTVIARRLCKDPRNRRALQIWIILECFKILFSIFREAWAASLYVLSIISKGMTYS